MFKTIKSKFIFFSAFLILLTTAVPMYFLVTQLRANFEDRSISMLDTSLEVVRYALKYAMMTGKQEDLQYVIDDITQKEGVYNIRIFDSEGTIRFASIPDEINKNITSDTTFMNEAYIKLGLTVVGWMLGFFILFKILVWLTT